MTLSDTSEAHFATLSAPCCERHKLVIRCHKVLLKCAALSYTDSLLGPLEIGPRLSVLKRCVPKTLAFAFGLRLRSKTQCSKTRVLGRRLPNGKPQERLRFRALRSKMLAFKNRIAIIFCDLKTSLGARACIQVLFVQKTRRFASAFLSPLRA